jgi:hypothetical protein
MTKPLLIDPDAPKMLDEMLAEVLEGQFPTDKPESRKIKAATLAAAIRAMMKKEGLTVIREADVIPIQCEPIQFTDAEIALDGLSEIDFIREKATDHMMAVATIAVKAGLFERNMGHVEGTEQRALSFTTRLFVPGFSMLVAKKVAEHEAADATIQ